MLYFKGGPKDYYFLSSTFTEVTPIVWRGKEYTIILYISEEFLGQKPKPKISVFRSSSTMGHKVLPCFSQGPMWYGARIKLNVFYMLWFDVSLDPLF